MKILDLIEQIVATNSQQFVDLKKLELSELERAIRHTENLKVALEHCRSRLLNKPEKKVEYYTVKEAATKLKVTGQTIYNLLDSGKLECNRIGVKILITEEQIQNYLKLK